MMSLSMSLQNASLAYPTLYLMQYIVHVKPECILESSEIDD